MFWTGLNTLNCCVHLSLMSNLKKTRERPHCKEYRQKNSVLIIVGAEYMAFVTITAIY